MRITNTHIYFWSEKDFLSNFYPSPFIIDNYNYRFVEEYIMRKKALLFEDDDILNKIAQAKTPYAIKKLGRQVKNFDNIIWLEYRDKILYDGIFEKFNQNKDLKKLLLDTYNKILVEASKYDKIYGVGLEESNDNILNEENWKGENLLGKTLMLVRYNLS
jgi:hypothetical protein